MSPFKSRFVSFKNNLTKIKKKEPLGALSLIVIILLDIFVLTVVFKGLSDHTDQLTSAKQYTPKTCREVLIDQSWTSVNEIDKLQKVVLIEHNRYRSSHSLDLKRMHPKCKEFYLSIEAIKEDSQLKKLFIKRQSLQRESNQLNISAKNRKAVTDNSFLTDISQGNDLNKHPSLSAKTRAEISKLEILTSKLNKIDTDIRTTHQVKKLLVKVNSWSHSQRQQLITELRAFEKWRKFKELGWQMLFLIPLFLIFYFWNSRSIKKESGLQTLLSTHLLVVTTIPIFIKIIELVLELIPRYFFKKLFEVLSSLHLIAIWHYVSILISILVAIFLIYSIQKKLFNKKRLQQKRLSNSSCIECGKKIPANVKVCPFCGKHQVEECSVCNKETFICGDFCVHCGSRRDNG